jgi:hypothetical protein
VWEVREYEILEADLLLDQEGVGLCCFCPAAVLPTFPYKSIEAIASHFFLTLAGRRPVFVFEGRRVR